MSLDVFLMTFKDGQESLADAPAARAVLDRVPYIRDPETGSHYLINFDDGSHLELIASGLHGEDKPFEGAMFSHCHITGPTCDFIFEFAKAAGSAILPVMDPLYLFIPRSDLMAEIPHDLSGSYELAHINSGSELFDYFEPYSETP